MPPHLQDALAPATWIVEEWREYWLSHDRDHLVTVGSVAVGQSPPRSGNTRIRFENQLGLATIRVRDAAGTEVDRHDVEVIAGKFGSAEDSVAFLQATVHDLFNHLAVTPFGLTAETRRFVRESPVPPTPLFVFHYFRQHAREIVRAVQAVLGRPHQRLDADPVLVRPYEVRHVDPEAIAGILRSGRPVGAVAAGLPDTPLYRLRPERVWQRIPVETFDTPENRFVLHVARSMLRAARHLMAQGWYGASVPPAVRQQVREASDALAMLVQDDRFASLGPMVVTPAQSRVLQRRDGYREANELWQRFQRSREPLFERMQAAIDLRSVDQLYELWVLFELIAQISAITGNPPILAPKVDEFGAPAGGYTARFGAKGTLHYNQTQSTYSRIALRPDYLWQPASGPSVALDAKFRLRQPKVLIEGEFGEAEWVTTGDPSRATTADLAKMHAYRDAIPNVRAAVVLYPGETTVFRSLDGVKRSLSLQDILDGAWEGIGAIALAPHGVAARDDGWEVTHACGCAAEEPTLADVRLSRSGSVCHHDLRPQPRAVVRERG